MLAGREIAADMLAVVVTERIRHHEVRLALRDGPIRQVVIVGIGIV
jgi:hypothetical protein